MVQVLAPVERKPSFLQQLSAGVGRGLEAGQQMYSQNQQQKAMQQAGFGDLAGLSPELQKVAISERLRQQGKEKLFGQKQDFLNKVLGGEQVARGAGGISEPEFNEMAPGRQSLDVASIPDEVIAQASAIDPNIGRSLQHAKDVALREKTAAKKEAFEREKFETRQKSEERSFQTSYSKKAEEEADSLRQTLPKKEMALDFARNAVETGELSYFSPDKLADATGIDLFRTAKGAQLTTAGKENLLSNMSRVGAKAQNLWFEQRLNSMFPKIGQSKEANLTVQEMLEGESLLDKAYLNEFDRLKTEDEDKFGFVRKDIKKRAQDAVKPIEKDILRRTTYRMKEIEEEERGLSGLKSMAGKNVSKGTPLTLAMARIYKDKFGENALKVAEKNGYYIPTLEEYQMIRSPVHEYREEIAR